MKISDENIPYCLKNREASKDDERCKQCHFYNDCSIEIKCHYCRKQINKEKEKYKKDFEIFENKINTLCVRERYYHLNCFEKIKEEKYSEEFHKDESE